MGNSASSSDEEDGKEQRKMDGSTSDGEESEEKSGLSASDLSGLFNHANLRTMAANIKEEIPENVLQQYRFQIVRWLEDRENKLEETLTVSQFCDWLQNKGVSREEAARAFQQFDTDGSGIVEVNTILTVVKSMNGANVLGELGRSIRMLQACSLTPGFVDVYAGDQNAVQQHAEKILRYLLRNRAPSLSLPFPYLNGFNNTTSMRSLVLKSIFQQVQETGQIQAQDNMGSGEEVRTVNPCYSNVEVSSNTSDAYRLTNGDPNTFWQSDGSARSHWIRLHIKSNVVIKSLSISVASSDSSYMPELISVTAGKNFRTLRCIKEVNIPSYITGDVVLLQNAKMYYPIIQINIKRCRNDGCDTRIHGLKSVGYKVIREPGVNVGDASAMWYLQVLATTVTMTMPLAPQLRPVILQHTKNALQHIPPLSLCPASGERPKFLTRYVLQEVEKFVTDLATHNNEVVKEGLHVLLSFNLARGNVAALLRTVKLLQDDPEISLPCANLLMQMQQARNTCWEKTGHQLTLSLSGCDGGQSDDNTGPQNVLNQSWTTPVQTSYISQDGSTKVNMIFKSEDVIQLTRLRIKVVSGGKGAKRGLVFVYRDESKEFELNNHVERFKTYDSWGKQEYDFSLQIRSTSTSIKQDNPVAYFNFDDDCDEIDIPVSWYPTGQFVLVKFLETRQESTKIGIVGIKFYGFVRKASLVDNESEMKHIGNSEKSEDCSSVEIVQATLQFIIDLSQDQALKRRSYVGKAEYLEFSDIPLDIIWILYSNFRESEKWQDCYMLCLRLLHCLLPVLTSLTDERKTAAEEFFKHICSHIDEPLHQEGKSSFDMLCRQLIVDGAAVFFPDKDARRKHLFSMMHNVEGLSNTPSIMLIFQSLCQFFSSVDPSGLLNLPNADYKNYDVESVLEMMETMISVLYHELCTTIKTGQSQAQVLHLVKLVSSLQTSMFAWCWTNLESKEDTAENATSQAARELAIQVASRYSVFVSEKASDACKLLLSLDTENLISAINQLEDSFMGNIVRQLVLSLTYLSDSCCSQTRIHLVHNFKSLCENLQALSQKLPNLFPQIGSDHWATVQTEDIVLRTWDVESSHNYENNQHHTQVFSCPGSSKFVVDFDPRCETERRYDYLVFTDAKGLHMRFDQKVGSVKWPKQVNFSGPHLHFLFHSDSSNTEWGFKFKVTARGSPDIPLSWPFDLQLSLTKMLGRLCGATLKAEPNAGQEAQPDLTADKDLLKSQLWTSLFRGGYMIGRIERSLSGKFSTADPGMVIEFLWDMIGRKNGLPSQILDSCREQQRGTLIDNNEIDEAVTAVFAALLWHTQQLREDLQKIITGNSSVTDGILMAYSTADSLKPQLMSQKQKLSTKTNNEEVEDPAKTCQDKALFLLKFAGLTKVQLKNEIRSKVSKQRKVSNKNSEKKQSKFDATEKYPSFKLILDFVQDPAWITDRVHRMLQQRSKHAKALSEVYSFCVEFLQIHEYPDVFQIPVVLFLQELLYYQDGFSKHYADSLDGCGLQQESLVREAYYSLIRKLTQPFLKHKRFEIEKNKVPAYEYIQTCLLHLIDVEWQPFDLSFIQEVNLPALYLSIAKETVKMRECTYGQEEEEKELREYNQCMKWFNQCSEGFEKWYDMVKKEEAKEEKMAVQMFVARFCDLLDVEISCDGCGVTLPGRRFRCLQCVDMDLCATCYAGGVKPEGDHSDNHDIVHLVYKCNKCQAFIVGTRIHCNVCEDFDLCFGCHDKGAYPSEHSSSHDITKFPLVKLRTVQDSDSFIQGYIHQHVWLLFTILAIWTGEILLSSQLHLDYIKLAAELQSQSTQIITQCLKQVPDDAEDGGKGLQENDRNLLAMERKQEEAFAIHTQERIMGLLGAMLPNDNTLMSVGKCNFTTPEFIQLLFKIARGDSGHEVNTRHLAMGLLGPLLIRSDPVIADQAIQQEEEKESNLPGHQCIKYLFSFGADCLQKCGLEWACSVSKILQNLYNSPEWKAVIHNQLTSYIHMLNSKPSLHSIFALFVIAGFPEVLTIGTLVNFSQHAGFERKTGVVLKHFPDKNQTLIIDVKTRRRHTVLDKHVDCISTAEQVWNSANLSVFFMTAQTIIEQIREEAEVTVETAWVLSLCLKMLSNCLKRSNNTQMPEMFQSGFTQCLVFIASKGTEFSQQWLLKDLEILSLMLYTNQGGPSTNIKSHHPSFSEQLAAALEKQTKSKSIELLSEEASEDYWSSSSSSSSMSSSDDTVTSRPAAAKGTTDIDTIFEDIDEKTKLMFDTLHSDLKVPLDVLRVIYDMNNKSPDDVVKAVIENLESSPIIAREDIKRLSEKWESIAHAKSPEAALETAVSDKVIDTGVHYHPVIGHINRALDKATEEECVELQKLIDTSESDIDGDILKQQRSKSSELLKQELEKQGRTCSREYICKVNMAMSILYARRVLTSLLATWPDFGPPITTELLGCKDIQQIPCILDLLNKTESKERFQSVVRNVIKHCGTDSLIKVANTAAQFMEEVTLSSLAKESDHNYKETSAVKDKIQLPGASCLRISFDGRCALRESEALLVFSSSSDLQQDRHEFKGSTPATWTSFQIPGDTVHYEFSVLTESSPLWGYKFTVTAGTRDSFQTGFAILHSVLATDLALSLPLSDMWKILVFVATKQTGQQRLKAIHLLLKILQIQHRNNKEDSLQLDLSRLKPLWQLYTNSTKQDTDSSVVLSPVIRALTELFLQVENITMEWNISTDYLIGIQDIDDLRRIVGQGIMNVAAVSTMIGIQNPATELISLIKKKKSTDK